MTKEDHIKYWLETAYLEKIKEFKEWLRTLIKI